MVIRRTHGEVCHFAPGFRIALHRKDLDLALASARSLGVSLPNTASCRELFNGASDHSALVRVLERLSCHEVGAAGEGAEPWRPPNATC